jgi:hypothetical protein
VLYAEEGQFNPKAARSERKQVTRQVSLAARSNASRTQNDSRTGSETELMRLASIHCSLLSSRNVAIRSMRICRQSGSESWLPQLWRRVAAMVTTQILIWMHSEMNSSTVVQIWQWFPTYKG